MMIQTALSLPNYCTEFFKRSLPACILYGAGSGCADVLTMFQSYHVQPLAICDSSPKKWGTSMQGIPVMQLKEVLQQIEGKEFFIYISAPAHIHEILPVLLPYIDEKQIYYFGWEQKLKTDTYKKYISLHEAQLCEIYEKLSDEYSKKTMAAMIYARASCDFRYYKSVYCENQYFPDDLVQISKDEVFLDIGAYTGDTVEQFLQKWGNSCKKIIAVEPNPNCVRRLNRIKSEHACVHVINMGVSDMPSVRNFHNASVSAASAHFTVSIAENDLEIPLDTIDNIVTDAVTLIKMDIEGMELSALRGAYKTICRNRPKLAICVYHKMEDILEISNWILSLNLGYHLYLRHHTYYLGETVLYAI